MKGGYDIRWCFLLLTAARNQAVVAVHHVVCNNQRDPWSFLSQTVLIPLYQNPPPGLLYDLSGGLMGTILSGRDPGIPG
jgi:hypothetical protein